MRKGYAAFVVLGVFTPLIIFSRLRKVNSMASMFVTGIGIKMPLTSLVCFVYCRKLCFYSKRSQYTSNSYFG